MKVRYVGGHDAVVVPMPGGGEQEVARHEVLEVSDRHGQGLLEQPANWEAVKAAEKEKKD